VVSLRALSLLTLPLGATIQVGPSRTITQLSAVTQGSVMPGDVIEVDGDATYSPVRWTRSGTKKKPAVNAEVRLTNAKVRKHVFLEEMLGDSYFPKHLVKKGQQLLVALALQRAPGGIRRSRERDRDGSAREHRRGRRVSARSVRLRRGSRRGDRATRLVTAQPRRGGAARSECS
jgi:hypothetical protein